MQVIPVSRTLVVGGGAVQGFGEATGLVVGVLGEVFLGVAHDRTHHHEDELVSAYRGRLSEQSLDVLRARDEVGLGRTQAELDDISVLQGESGSGYEGPIVQNVLKSVADERDTFPVGKTPWLTGARSPKPEQ